MKCTLSSFHSLSLHSSWLSSGLCCCCASFVLIECAHFTCHSIITKARTQHKPAIYFHNLLTFSLWLIYNGWGMKEAWNKPKEKRKKKWKEMVGLFLLLVHLFHSFFVLLLWLFSCFTCVPLQKSKAKGTKGMRRKWTRRKEPPLIKS